MNLNSRIVVSRKLILFVFLMSIIRFHGISQCDFSLLPDGELCTDAIYLCGNELDGYTDRMPTELAEPLPWIILIKKTNKINFLLTTILLFKFMAFVWNQKHCQTLRKGNTNSPKMGSSDYKLLHFFY